MYPFKVSLFLEAILIAGALTSLFPSSASELTCGECDLNIYCCSKWNQCGISDDHCREENCIKGRCYPKCKDTDLLSVGDIVTEEFWKGIVSSNEGDPNCPGMEFYSRDAFLAAADSFLEFASSCSNDERKREIAAFFGHVSHETGSFCSINEHNRGHYCEASQEYKCNPQKKYFGRGPLQLRWNYNYIVAGESLGFDGMNEPDVVGTDVGSCFKASFWFWMYRGMHSTFTSANKGFGETIRIITQGNECDGSEPGKMDARVDFYKKYCRQLGVDPGDNLTC